MFSIGNSVALLALLAWPLAVFVMFRVLTIERALIWSILGGYMILPQLSEINLPGIPSFNKETIPNLAAFTGCLYVIGRFPALLPESGLGKLLLVVFVISPSVTVLTNLEPIMFGITTIGTLEMLDTSNLERASLPGLRAYDAVSSLVNQLFVMLPFFLARNILNTAKALHEVLVALVIAGLIYALPMLFEVRFSPQLHTMVYGFFQHDFIQAIRAGGFRPFVFMPHGIWVAFFAFMCTMAAAALMRQTPLPQRGRMVFLALFMAGLLVLCKTLGAMLLALVFLPILLLLQPRSQLAVSASIALGVLAYPLLRSSGLLPLDAILARLTGFNPDRAQSLDYRFTNEDLILEHVSQKMWFGWGGWGRSIPHEPLIGTSDVVVDGAWIIAIGQSGWLGYLALFGLLSLPLLLLWWEARKLHAPMVPLSVSAVALILAANLLDMIPNDTLIPFTWLIAGALLGYAEALARATTTARREILQKRYNPAPDAPAAASQKPRTLL
ncbi:MAG TPA: hypothetical protein GX700_02475 [Paracoccus sp.]|nr:hypothetical protein [Paracoccus sp. (in: a-proteobacteria)]